MKKIVLSFLLLACVWTSAQAAYIPNPQKSAMSTQVTGFSLTIPDGVTIYIVNSAIALLAGTITLTANPLDGQPLTIESPKGVVALVVNPNTGQAISGNTISVATANTPIRLKYSGINQTWYPN